MHQTKEHMVISDLIICHLLQWDKAEIGLRLK